MKKGINEFELKEILGQVSKGHPYTIAGVPALIANNKIIAKALKGAAIMGRDGLPMILTTRSGGVCSLHEDVDMIYLNDESAKANITEEIQSPSEAWDTIEEITCSLYPKVPSSFFSMEPPFDRDQVFTFHTLLDEGLFLTGDAWKVYTGELETCDEITMVQVNPYKDVDINAVKGACNICICGDRYVRFLGRKKHIIYVDGVETKVADGLIHVVNPPIINPYPLKLTEYPYNIDSARYNHNPDYDTSDAQLKLTPIKPNGDTIKIVGTEVLRSKQPGCMHVKLSIQFNDKIEECVGIFEYGGGTHFNAEFRLKYESRSYKVDAKVVVASCGISEITITDITK